MHKLRHPLLRNNVHQLFWLVVGFVVCISLLESKGFVAWAQQQDVSSAQQKMLQLAQTFDEGVSQVAGPVTRIRPDALTFLRQHGWSDVVDSSENIEADVNDTGEEHTDGNQVKPSELQAPQEEPASISTSITDTATGGRDSGEEEESPKAADGPVTKRFLADPVDQTVAQPKAIDEPQEGKQKKELETQAGLPALQPSAEMVLPPLPQASAKKPRTVVLAGDSMMAVGLSGQLRRDLEPYKASVVTVNAYRSATGLARPEVFDWQVNYPALVKGKRADVVIVAIGANDTQNLAVNKKVLKIGSDEWRQEYGQRVKNYLDMLTHNGAVVLWIKLPPMKNKSSKYNESVKAVNAVAEEVVKQNSRAIWWDPSARFLNDKGQFQEFAILKQNGKPVRIRQEDGTHLTDAGAKLLTGDIIQWLHPAPPEEKKPEVSSVDRAQTPAPIVEEIIKPGNPVDAGKAAQAIRTVSSKTHPDQ